MKRSRKSNKRGLRLWLGLVILAVGGVAYMVHSSRLVLNGDKEVIINVNEGFKDPGVRIANNDQPIPPTKLAKKGHINLHQPGEYQIEYNYSTFFIPRKITRTVAVKDLKKPELQLNGPAKMQLLAGTPYRELGAAEKDNYDKQLPPVKVKGKVDPNKPGTYKITYMTKDHAGNVSTAKRLVTVSEGIIYLTFDDGPKAETTPQFLKILKDEEVEATFFVTGHGPDELLKQIKADGHTIGLHTYTHDYASVYRSDQSYFDDLNKIADRVKRVTGEESKLIRFPGGSSNTISLNYSPGIMGRLKPAVREKGYQYFDWNVSSGDGSNQLSAEQPLHNVTSTLKPGQENVVLMHDTKQTSADALKGIIEFGKQNHYAFQKLSLDSYPAHHGE